MGAASSGGTLENDPGPAQVSSCSTYAGCQIQMLGKLCACPPAKVRGADRGGGWDEVAELRRNSYPKATHFNAVFMICGYALLRIIPDRGYLAMGLGSGTNVRDAGPAGKMLMARERVQERLDWFACQLRSRGQRVTCQRLAILRAVLESECHPSAEEILRKVVVNHPATGLGTVYSTLGLLARLGEVVVVPTPNGSRYDACRVTPHAHLVCARCHAVSDLDVDQAELAGVMLAEAEAQGYRSTEVHLRVLGLCPRCQKSGSRPPAGKDGEGRRGDV